MKILRTYYFAALIAGFLACGGLMADTLTVPGDGLPDGDTDTLAITLTPSSGALSAAAGSTTGWGFTVDWTSTDGDWLVFTGSSIDGDSNPSILGPSGYTDFMGLQGGPFDFGLEALPDGQDTYWTQTFNSAAQEGVGSYQVASGAGIGAQDAGEITFDFEVWNGDPTIDGQQIGNLEEDYTYAGDSTAFTVNVAAPEPNTALLMAGMLLFAGTVFVVRKRSKVHEPFVG